MKKIMKATGIVGKVLVFFSIAALLVMLFVTIADIIMRNFFNSPIVGAIEIATS